LALIQLSNSPLNAGDEWEMMGETEALPNTHNPGSHASIRVTFVTRLRRFCDVFPDILLNCANILFLLTSAFKHVVMIPLPKHGEEHMSLRIVM
jgi:hypothetical protein